MYWYVAGHHNEWKRIDSSESQGADAGFADHISCHGGHEPGLVRHGERQQLMFGNSHEHIDSNSCSGTVMSITAGSLGAIVGSPTLGLEEPKRMRTSADTVNFPQGRGLILENIDGFPPTAPVFRKSPHLLNLSQRIAFFGLSGNVFDLQTFATGAVTQHFPRTLARNSGGSNPDFRLPTSDELAAMEAFMRDRKSTRLNSSHRT